MKKGTKCEECHDADASGVFFIKFLDLDDYENTVALCIYCVSVYQGDTQYSVEG